MSGSSSPGEIHPEILGVLAALDAADVDWLLFRGEERLRRPTGDIDLLIAPRDLDAADAVMSTRGFTRLSSALLVTRRAYVAYVSHDDLWLRFDVVADVSFGKNLEFATSVAPALLARKRRSGDLNLPEENDAFWHLLLHYMLDRGDIPLPWREIVHERAHGAHVAGPLTDFVDALPVEVTSDTILTATRAGDWSTLHALFVALRKAWLASQGSASHVRSRANRALSRVGLGQWTSFRPGLSVAVLGPDGAGKTTLANGLRDSIAIPTDYVYMGLWKDDRLQQLLSHIPGSNLFLLLVRLAVRSGRLNYYRWRGHVVILDRFSYDAVLVTEDATWRQRLTAALVLRLTRAPDLIVVLDLPGEVAFARKGEQDIATLNQWRASYRALEAGTTPLVVLDATQPIAEVRRLATEEIWRVIRRRSEHQS